MPRRRGLTRASIYKIIMSRKQMDLPGLARQWRTGVRGHVPGLPPPAGEGVPRLVIPSHDDYPGVIPGRGLKAGSPESKPGCGVWIPGYGLRPSPE
jgi:hypothetical protein